MKRTAALVSLAVLPFVAAQQGLWQQCGGINWTGGTTCVAGSYCMVYNDWYHQCIPGQGQTTTTTTTTQPPTTQPPTTTTTTTNVPAPTGFVGVSGQKFVLNGEPYFVAGANAYWLAQNSDADIDKGFSDLKAAGLTTVRTWGFNDRTSPQDWGAYYQLFQNGQQIFNTGAYGISRFDAVIASAKKHGIHLIVALTNNWSDYGGMDVYVQALGCGQHGDFYTNTKCINAFQTYIRNFVGRYKDEPTVLAWELANEPRCGGSNGGKGSCTSATITQWAKDISQFIKSIDSNHLVALGDEGFYEGGDSSGGYPYNAGEGINFVTNLGISSLDFGTAHMYPDHWGQASNGQNWGVKWITDHAANQKAANKPVILEEFGILDNQVQVYTAWFNAVINSGLTGFLYWQAGSQLSFGPTHDDGYAVYPTSPTYPLVRDAAARVKARG